MLQSSRAVQYVYIIISSFKCMNLAVGSMDRIAREVLYISVQCVYISSVQCMNLQWNQCIEVHVW